ncbi:MAG: hypothetical protein RL748_1471 [Pseudomonadota bacterium]|jgi:DNA-binding NarL/FixJ family response regulator
MKQKILVVDDDPYAVAGVVTALRSKYDVVSAKNPADMEEKLKNNTFALVILDLDFKKRGNGLDHLASIQERGNIVLVLTNEFDQASINTCLRAQVAGYVLKDSKHDLVAKVNGAVLGQNVTDTALLADFANEKRLPKFGWQEVKLIDYIFASPFATETQYANWMGLAAGTIGNKFSSLYAKLGVHSKHELLAELKRLGHRPREVDVRSAAEQKAAAATPPAPDLP